uniref:Uncharacterized protein n=1 Tax=Branchiostoma floridae TaxID=7739 RepID=C3YYT1_BRAFL|eukprot:XP_002598427.1 hypothetical protein BRAFLDRAFT_83225 [Branchiostoma floridae]
MRTNNRRRLIHRLLAVFRAVPVETQHPCRTRPWWTGGATSVAEGVTVSTREPKIKTTKLILNQTNASTNGTVKEKSPRVAFITMVVVVGVVLVALFVMYVVRRCSRGDQAAQAAGHLAGVHGTAPSRTTQQSSSSGDDPQYSVIPDEYYNQQNSGTSSSTTQQTTDDYSQIPDEHFNYYNTRPDAQHPYWEIPDEYYNRYNTYPSTRRVTQDGEDYSVRFNTATSEIVLPSSTRLGARRGGYKRTLFLSHKETEKEVKFRGIGDIYGERIWRRVEEETGRGWWEEGPCALAAVSAVSHARRSEEFSAARVGVSRQPALTPGSTRDSLPQYPRPAPAAYRFFLRYPAASDKQLQNNAFHMY